MDMNSEIPKWLLLEPAVCFPNQSEEASQNKTEEEEEEMERFKRPRTTLDSDGGVEEFLALLERIEETKKLSKKRSMNFSRSCTINAVEGDQTLVAPPLMQAQGSSDLSGVAATKKSKEEEESIQKGNGFLKTRSFLDGFTASECSHAHVDDVNKKEDDDVDAPPELGLQLFPCL
eukprot:PITA_34406